MLITKLPTEILSQILLKCVNLELKIINKAFYKAIFLNIKNIFRQLYNLFSCYKPYKFILYSRKNTITNESFFNARMFVNYTDLVKVQYDQNELLNHVRKILRGSCLPFRIESFGVHRNLSD